MSPDEVGGADESGGAAGAGEAAPAPIDPRLVEYARTHDRALRNALVEDNMGLALHFTTRYRRSDTEDDDLRQVALLGLVKAIDRFDPTRGVAFSTFAGRTIDGELKRHFRDQTWALRVPRSVKDLNVSVRRASEALEQQLSRSPTVRELADHLDVSVDEVIGALGATAARRAGSLDDLDPQGATTTPRAGSSLDVRPELVAQFLGTRVVRVQQRGAIVGQQEIEPLPAPQGGPVGRGDLQGRRRVLHRLEVGGVVEVQAAMADRRMLGCEPRRGVIRAGDIHHGDVALGTARGKQRIHCGRQRRHVVVRDDRDLDVGRKWQQRHEVRVNHQRRPSPGKR